MPIRTFLFAIILLVSFNSSAQKNREEVLGTWTIVAGSHRVSDRISIPTVALLRHYEILYHYEFFFFRTGISYDFSPKVCGTIGFARLDSEPFIQSKEAKSAFYQNWLYEELTLKNKLGKFDISHRYRLENRWIETVDGTHLKHRFRYRLRCLYPLTKKLYINAFNEVFISLQAPLFNQNRLHLGLGYKVSPSVKLEMGFLKNHFSTANYEYIRAGMVFKTDLRIKSNP